MRNVEKLETLDAEEDQLLARLVAIRREKRAAKGRADALFKRGSAVVEASLPSGSTPAPGFLAAQHASPSSGEASGTTEFPPLSDADWAAILDPALLGDRGSGGGTVLSAQGSPGSREVPTS